MAIDEAPITLDAPASVDAPAGAGASPSRMFDNSPSKMKATRAFVAMSILFFVFTVGTGFVIAAHKGYGAGPWDSHTVWSCYGPGGHPYYLKDRPISQQPCPSPYDTALNSHGRLPAKDAPPHPR